ncbi:MAG: hypothetical protein WA718_23475, partial [Terriglobales bacterium]
MKVAFTTCVPVVMVTVRAPVAAESLIAMGTDALVGPFTVTVPVVIPEPKLTVVLELKFVLLPVIAIVSFAPWCADDGLSIAE